MGFDRHFRVSVIGNRDANGFLRPRSVTVFMAVTLMPTTWPGAQPTGLAPMRHHGWRQSYRMPTTVSTLAMVFQCSRTCAPNGSSSGSMSCAGSCARAACCWWRRPSAFFQ